ncbi:hypothetical protein XI06_35200 [Bradyrhizobium sp. CCBAU 11434]|nr:hypothetical protein [Bradyrhizobium sp. CCBAU 11434]
MQNGRAENLVAEYGSDALLSTPTEDIVELAYDVCHLEVPVLLEDKAFQADPREVTREVRDYGRMISVQGFQYGITIPFEGYLGLFRHSSALSVGDSPRAKANEDGIILTASGYNLTKEELQTHFKKVIDAIKLRLSGQEKVVKPFNEALRPMVRKLVEERKKGILAARNIAESLGYPMVRAGHVPMTHVPAQMRRRIRPSLPPQTSKAYSPEPALEEAEYQHILKIIDDMSVMMERSPTAFERLEEEHLRDFYLVVLNGHYEGRATGETFNASGKTDILIRENNRNVFIAECKYWHGPQTLTDALDQLLGYLTWRDTKAALIMFNRNKNFTAMVKKMVETASEHPNCKCDPVQESETRYRYVFASKDDPARQIILTVMAVDVPNPSDE